MKIRKADAEIERQRNYAQIPSKLIDRKEINFFFFVALGKSWRVSDRRRMEPTGS